MNKQKQRATLDGERWSMYSRPYALVELLIRAEVFDVSVIETVS